MGITHMLIRWAESKFENAQFYTYNFISPLIAICRPLSPSYRPYRHLIRKVEFLIAPYRHSIFQFLTDMTKLG